MIQSREYKHLSVVVGKLSVLEGTGNSPGLSSTVPFCRFYCYGKYTLCARKKKGLLLCASEEFCGGIEERCRNKTLYTRY